MKDNVEYDPETNTYRVIHDWTDDISLSTAVILAIEEVLPGEASPEPLFDVVDPDALDAIFRSRSDDAPHRRDRVRFTISDHRVTVYAYGLIEVEPPGEQ